MAEIERELDWDSKIDTNIPDFTVLPKRRLRFCGSFI